VDHPRNAHHRPILMLLGLLAAVAPAAAEQAVVPQANPQRSGDHWLRVQVRSPTQIDTATDTEEGRLIVAAVDGGLLLETTDTRYVTIQPDTIIAREAIASPPAADEPRALGQRILAELPAGFELHLTQHYIVCHATSRDYARWAGGLFERLHDAFGNYWTRAGLELTAVERPLIVLIFANRRDYEAYAVRDLGAAADRVVGYYNLLSNRIATYDLTGSDALPRRAGHSGRPVTPGRRSARFSPSPRLRGSSPRSFTRPPTSSPSIAACTAGWHPCRCGSARASPPSSKHPTCEAPGAGAGSAW